MSRLDPHIALKRSIGERSCSDRTEQTQINPLIKSKRNILKNINLWMKFFCWSRFAYTAQKKICHLLCPFPSMIYIICISANKNDIPKQNINNNRSIVNPAGREFDISIYNRLRPFLSSGIFRLGCESRWEKNNCPDVNNFSDKKIRFSSFLSRFPTITAVLLLC